MAMPTEDTRAAMLARIPHWALHNRLVVLLLLGVVVVAGVLTYQRLPTDAFPDISPVMVPVFAEAHGMAPEEVERLITTPIESAMSGLPGVVQLSSTSAFGMAVVYVYFADDMNIYFCRQIVAERLAGAMADLPQLHEPPQLGPISTGLGEVFMYYLTADASVDSGGKSRNTYLRELNDWVVKRGLEAVPGITDVLSMGGNVLQYQVLVDPSALNRYHLELSEVVDAITANNDNVGGQFLVLGQQEHLVRGIGLIEGLKDLSRLQVKVVEGTPIELGDIAQVRFGSEVRRGVVVLDGTQEIVAGIVLKLYGENTSIVIDRLLHKIEEIQESLPAGVQLVPYYDQSSLVSKAVATVRDAMVVGAVLVVLSLFLFLGNLRSAIIVTAALPLCALVAFLLMGWQGISANLMSLGGIAVAIGMLGDGAIVMVENIFRRLGEQPLRMANAGLQTIDRAAAEVVRPIVFSVAIIIIVFLPLLTLTGVEGKMFRPMALTIAFALMGSLVAALVLAPVLTSLVLPRSVSAEPGYLTWVKQRYRRVLLVLLRRRRVAAVGAGGALLAAVALLPMLGTEFMPVLEEGAVQINVAMSPSISLVEATALVSEMQRAIVDMPEIGKSVAKIGRPEAGSHPHPVNFGMIQAQLRPVSEWRGHATTKRELIAALAHRLEGFPGVQLSFTQPIQNLFDELLSGVRTQLAIKLFGDDLTTLQETAEEIREVIEGVPGLVDLAVEQSFGQPQVQIIADRRACARANVDVADILEIVELAVGGEVVDEVYLNTRRFGIFVRYLERYRDNPEALGNLLVSSADGALLPLAQLARIERVVGPVQINREHNQRRWVISANVRGRDLGSVVADLKRSIAQRVSLPPGYVVEYGGQFENQQRAMARLTMIVPAALALIFLLLYLSLGRLRYAVLIFTTIPLALIGGVLGLYVTGEYLSVPASVGFIALFGIVVQNGLVLVTCIASLLERGIPVSEAVIQGATLRLRPVLMTALTTMLGLVPLLLSSGIGAEVQRPLAVVVVSGLISSTVLTLLLVPAWFEWFVGDTKREDMTLATE